MSRVPIKPRLPPPAERTERVDETQHPAERRAVNLRRALDRRVASVLESVTHAFLALDRDWRVTYANPEAARLNGTTPEALIGRDHWETWPETVGSTLERHYRQAVAEQTPAHFVHHYPAEDVWHEVHAYPADDGGLAVLYRDISEERRAEAERDKLAVALAARERELATVLENATDVVMRFDAACRVTYANRALESATGLTPEDVLGKSYDQLPFPAEFTARWNAALARVRATGHGVELAFEYPGPDGPRHYDSRFIPEPGPGGAVETVLVLTRDVTERVLGEVALAAALQLAESAKAEAEAANAAKTGFLATMSHELRTPLNAILGYTELLALGVYGGVTDPQRDALARITHSERHLLGLITEILDFARLETGRARYNLADVPLRDVLTEAHALVDPQLRGKGLAFAQDECACDGLVVRADAGKARQIVLNLLSNALKFTPAGGQVALRCRAEPTMAVVEVVDSGAGIPAGELERVFEPFVQLGRGRTDPVIGSGLGLAISRELARGMGGDLTAESTVGAGSLFRLTLPRI